MTNGRYVLLVTLCVSLMSAPARAERARAPVETAVHAGRTGRRLLIAGAVLGAAGGVVVGARLKARAERRSTQQEIVRQAERILEHPVPMGVLRKVSMNVNNGADAPIRMREIGKSFRNQGVAVAALQEFDDEAGREMLDEMGPNYAHVHAWAPKAPGSAEREPTGLAFVYDKRELELVGHALIALPRLGQLVGLDKVVMKNGEIEQRYAFITYFRDRRTGEIHQEVDAHLDAAGDGGLGASGRGTTHRTVQSYAIKQALVDLENHGRRLDTHPRTKHAVDLGPAVTEDQLREGPRKLWRGFKRIPTLYEESPTYSFVTADLSRMPAKVHFRTVYKDTNAAERRGNPEKAKGPALVRGIDRVKAPMEELGLVDPASEATYDRRQGWDPGKGHHLQQNVAWIPVLRGGVARVMGVDRAGTMDLLMVSGNQRVVSRATSPIPGPNGAENGREASDHRQKRVDVLRGGFEVVDGSVVGQFLPERWYKKLFLSQ
jgi:hypothetical protein